MAFYAIKTFQEYSIGFIDINIKHPDVIISCFQKYALLFLVNYNELRHAC